jgi:folate-binding protein YgfZ
MFVGHLPILMNPDLLQKIKAPAGAWMPGPRTLLKLTGEDRIRFLNGQVTQDLKKLQPGQAVRAAVITAKGKLEADCRIGATSEALWIETDGPLRESLRTRLEKFIVADDVTVEDVSDFYHLAHFPGLFAPPPNSPNDCLSFSTARFRGPGLDLWIPSSSTWKLESSSLSDWEPLRIARGLPLWGVDVGPDTLPPEAGFESDAISSTKGCYIGQEVISRLRSVGHVNRHLCILATANPPKLRPNAQAERTRSEGGPPFPCADSQGKPVGSLTSLTSVDDQALALAMIQRSHADPGNSVLAGGVTWTILRHA